MKTKVALLAMLIAAGGMVTAQARTYRIDIPPQPLDRALEDFAEQSELQVVYLAEIVQGIDSPGFTGEGVLEDVLPPLLAGSGLQWRIENERTVSIVEPAANNDEGAEAAEQPEAAPEEGPRNNDRATQPDDPEPDQGEGSARRQQTPAKDEPAGQGQQAAGEISGVIRSPGATPLPGVSVEVTNADIDASETAITDERGRYQSTGLAAGTYSVTAALPGFGSVTRDGVIVGAEGRVSVDLTLRPQVAQSITVTARKVEENLQDVPISISTISNEEIEQRSVVVFTEALDEMPNVVVGTNATQEPMIIIRGISSNINNVGIEPAISVYLDEVFLARPAAFEQSLIDIERVEVLRGPQGTAYGKNTIGGAINIVTIKPSSQAKGLLELATGNYNLKQVRGFFGGPISDTVFGQITLGVRQRDGWLENRSEGLDDLMSEDYKGARGRLRFKPSDKTDILMSLDYSKEENVQNVYDISGGGLYELDGEDGWDRSISTNKGDFFNRDVVGALVRGDFGLRRHTFTTLSAYRSFEAENFNDQDYSILDIVGTGRREELDFLSQEFRLASTSGAPFSYLVGLYFSDRTTKGRDRFRFGAAIPVLFGIGDIPGYEEWLVATSTIEEQVSAGFLSGSWAFSERGTFEFGFRYTSEDKAIGYRQDALPFYLSPGVPVGIIYALGPDVAPIHQGRSDSDPSGDLSLVYRLSEDVNGYARYAHGFKAGGFDSTVSSSSNPGDLEFDSEKVDAFELGIKSMLADTKVQLNAALFYMNYQDKQEQFFTGSEFRTGNAASVTSKGVEFELKVLPASGVEIFTTVGYTDASYEKFIDPVLGTDLSGNRLLAPKWTGSLAIQYYRPFAGSMGWFIRGAAHYRGENFTTVDNDPRWAQDAHTLVDARAGMDFRGGRYTVAIWGKNLTDVGYILTGYEFFGTTYQAVSEPRTFGVELRLRR